MGLSTLSLVQLLCIIPTVSSSFTGGSSSQHPSSQHPSTPDIVQQAVEGAFALQRQGSQSDVFTGQQASLASGLPIGPPPGLPSPPPGGFESVGSLSGLHAVPCPPVSKLRSSGVEGSFPSADHVGRCSPVLSGPDPTGSEPRLPASRLSPATGTPLDERRSFGSQNDDGCGARSRTDGRYSGPGPHHRYFESQNHNPASRGGIEEDPAGPREPASRFRRCDDNSGLFVRTTDGRLCEPTREDGGGWKLTPVERPLPAGRLQRTAQHEPPAGSVGTGGTGPGPHDEAHEAHARHPRDMSGTQAHVTCLGRPRDMDGRYSGPGPHHRSFESQNESPGIEEAGDPLPRFRDFHSSDFRSADNSHLVVRADGRLCKSTKENGGWKLIPVERPAGRLDRTAQHEAVGGFVGTGHHGAQAPHETCHDVSGTTERLQRTAQMVGKILDGAAQAHARAAEVHHTWGGAGERTARGGGGRESTRGHQSRQGSGPSRDLVAAAQAAQQVRPQHVPQQVQQQVRSQDVLQQVRSQDVLQQLQQQQQLLNDELWQEHRQLLAELQQAREACTTGTGHVFVGAGPAGAEGICGLLLTGVDTTTTTCAQICGELMAQHRRSGGR